MGENGVLLSGTGVARVRFEDVQLRVAILHNTSCTKGAPNATPTGCRDYRPRRDAPDVVPSATSVIYLEGDGSVTFDNVSVAFDGAPPAPYWLPPERGGLCSLGAASGVGRGWAVKATHGTAFACVPPSIASPMGRPR